VSREEASTETAEVGEEKADFDRLYDRPDPGGYLRTMHGLDYRIPWLAAPVFEAVLPRTGSATVLDLCCGYGINAAQLRFRTGLGTLAARHRDPAVPAAESLAADRELFAGDPGPRMVGLDISAPAISYAVRAGLLADGWAENLEDDDPSAELANGVRDVGLLISTGGVGYVGHRTFDRLLAALDAPERLWAVIFVLRMFDYADIAASFARYGLVTEQVPGLRLRQRRFVDQREFAAANRDVARRGLDPTGLESRGWYYADCYLTRPPAAAGEPVEGLLAPLAREC
jgi:SAM-dependent methyltransferase